jgi:sugar/nucleoside kinase (ribokinase family)
LDIVAIGALNVDFILAPFDQEATVESTIRFDWSDEVQVLQETIDLHLGQAAEAGVQIVTRLGGSAFNMLRALTRMRPELHAAFIGVGGTCGALDSDHKAALSRFGVDTAHLLVSERPSGSCISYVDGDSRKLEICTSANDAFAEYVTENLTVLATYIASADWIHLTSLFGEGAVDAMQRLLHGAKNLNPDLQVALDPGPAWSSTGASNLAALLGTVDLVFVNSRELSTLSPHVLGESAQVQELLGSLAPKAQVLLCRSYDSVGVFAADPLGVTSHEYAESDVLLEAIIDGTGAGDHLAAGVHAVHLSSGLQRFIGVKLGMGLARRKLQQTGPLDQTECAQVASAIRISHSHTSSDRTAAVESVVRLVGRGLAPLSWSRQRKRKSWPLDDEYDCQDLLHAVLLTHFEDVQPEVASSSSLGSGSRIDFLCAAERVGIEVKFLRSKAELHGMTDALLADMVRYRSLPGCDSIVIAIFDAARVLYSNRATFEAHLNEIGSSDFLVRCVVIDAVGPPVPNA